MNGKMNLIALAIAATIPMSVQAGRKVVDETAQIQIEVPDSWKESRDANSLTIETADEAVAMVFRTLEADAADGVIKAIDSELEKSLGKLAWENEGKGKEIDINGMKGKEWDGTAKEGQVIVACLALDTPASKILAIYYFATPESDKKYAEEIGSVIKGLKPLEGDEEEEEGDGEEEGEEEGEEK